MSKITVGDVKYSNKFGAGGWCTVLKVTGHKVLVKLEDYDGAIVTLDDVDLEKTPDEEYNDWLDERAEYEDLYPSRPIEL